MGADYAGMAWYALGWAGAVVWDDAVIEESLNALEEDSRKMWPLLSHLTEVLDIVRRLRQVGPQQAVCDRVDRVVHDAEQRFSVSPATSVYFVRLRSTKGSGSRRTGSSS